MIKALLLVLFPAPTWERIVTAQRTVVSIAVLHLLPLLLIGSVAEGFGMVHWGKPRGAMSHVETFKVAPTVIYETGQIVLLVGAVFIIAWLIKALGDTFHGRHTFRQAFTVAAYGLSPLFLMRLGDMFRGLSPWVTWAFGIMLAASILYKGLPRVMQPDPPHTFGLYLMSVLMITIVTGLARFLTAWYLNGRFTRLDEVISRIAAHLPF